MSVSPEDLGRGLTGPHDDDVVGHVLLPGSQPPSGRRRRRRVARTSVVAGIAAATALTAGVAVAAGKVPDAVQDAVDSVVDTLNASRATGSSAGAGRPDAAATPSHSPTAVGALLDRAEQHLDAGRLDAASAALTSAQRLLQRQTAAERGTGDVTRYDVLRQRLLAALANGAGQRPAGSAPPPRRGHGPGEGGGNGAGAKDDPAKGDAAKRDAAKGDPAEGDPAKREPVRREPAKGDASKGDASKGEPAEGDPANGGPAEGDPAKGEPTEDDPPQDVRTTRGPAAAQPSRDASAKPRA